MSDPTTFVIVGAGLAGAKAAETLRAERFDGRLVLVGAEAELPYERPPLSKSYLAGETPFAEAHVHDRSFYDEDGMEYFGLHAPGDRLVIRGSLDADSFQAFWVAGDERVSAGMHANDWDASEAIARLVETGEPGPAALSAAEPGLP